MILPDEEEGWCAIIILQRELCKHANVEVVYVYCAIPVSLRPGWHWESRILGPGFLQPNPQERQEYVFAWRPGTRKESVKISIYLSMNAAPSPLACVYIHVDVLYLCLTRERHHLLLLGC